VYKTIVLLGCGLMLLVYTSALFLSVVVHALGEGEGRPMDPSCNSQQGTIICRCDNLAWDQRLAESTPTTHPSLFAHSHGDV
jgi:hypothetical protein